MPVHRGNVLWVIDEAWKRASEGAKDGADKRKQNADRSTKWVDELAYGFLREYTDGTRHRVFWKGGKDNKKHFRRNEFLFDVMVCSVSKTESLQRQSNRLEFIDQCHWQAESEFNRRDSREVIVDMSKLVLGSAENKLFIAAHRERHQQKLLRMCGAIASRCDGNVYFAFVSHPDDWAKRSKQPLVYEWLAGDWVLLGDA